MNHTDASLAKLMEIVKILRSPHGCPWDREQTPNTIIPYLIEETYEAVDAIREGDGQHLMEELGDILLQVALLSQMGRESGQFTVEDSLNNICQKMIRRHPHVFGDEKGLTKQEITANWNKIKGEEKPKRGLLDGIPQSLPALLRAKRVGEKAKSVGFDWPDLGGVLDKVEEEIAELRAEIASGDTQKTAEEMGDLIFSLVNLSRHLKINPEDALNATTNKFVGRFRQVEAGIAAKGKTLKDATLEEMDELWEKAKSK